MVASTFLVQRIISGGQTGEDRAALDRVPFPVGLAVLLILSILLALIF